MTKMIRTPFVVFLSLCSVSAFTSPSQRSRVVYNTPSSSSRHINKNNPPQHVVLRAAEEGTPAGDSVVGVIADGAKEIVEKAIVEGAKSPAGDSVAASAVTDGATSAAIVDSAATEKVAAAAADGITKAAAAATSAAATSSTAAKDAVVAAATKGSDTAIDVMPAIDYDVISLVVGQENYGLAVVCLGEAAYTFYQAPSFSNARVFIPAGIAALGLGLVSGPMVTSGDPSQISTGLAIATVISIGLGASYVIRIISPVSETPKEIAGVGLLISLAGFFSFAQNLFVDGFIRLPSLPSF